MLLFNSISFTISVFCSSTARHNKGILFKFGIRNDIYIVFYLKYYRNIAIQISFKDLIWKFFKNRLFDISLKYVTLNFIEIIKKFHLKSQLKISFIN